MIPKEFHDPDNPARQRDYIILETSFQFYWPYERDYIIMEAVESESPHIGGSSQAEMANRPESVKGFLVGLARRSYLVIWRI